MSQFHNYLKPLYCISAAKRLDYEIDLIDEDFLLKLILFIVIPKTYAAPTSLNTYSLTQ